MKEPANATMSVAGVERAKKVCSNYSKVGRSGVKNFSKCAFCERTRYYSRDFHKAHLKVRLDEER